MVCARLCGEDNSLRKTCIVVIELFKKTPFFIVWLVHFARNQAAGPAPE